MEDKKKDLKIAFPVDLGSGVYSNMVIITHSFTEVILDFGQVMPNAAEPIVRSRVVMHPMHAKRLMYALQDNIAKYERNFGAIIDANSVQINGESASNDDDKKTEEVDNLPFGLTPQGDA